MDAIFQYPTTYMDKTLNWFGSYMERASLQLRVELEEYVESTVSASGSTFITEGASEFFEKFKAALKLIIQRLKEFIQDTKVNFQKYKKDKLTEKRINKLNSTINKSKKLKSLEVEYKDYSPKTKFIKREREALKRLVRKKGTKKEELILFMKRYKDSLSDEEKLGIKKILIKASIFASIGFIKGINDGLNDSCDYAYDTIEEYDEMCIKKAFVESAGTASVTDDSDLMVAYVKALAEMANDELITQRKIVEEFDKSFDQLEKEIDIALKDMDLGGDDL